MGSFITDTVRELRREFRLYTTRGVADYYENMGFDIAEERDQSPDDLRVPRWLNYGYWNGVNTQDAACRQMADLVAEAAHMGPDSHVLDCGFGFAEQDFHWLQTRNPAHITGINITQMHIDFAQKRVVDRGLTDRITLVNASATALPFADNSFDCVVALESAFHFDTREHFFDQALRVLKPGGWLAAADVLPLKGDPTPPWRNALLRRIFWPPANCYDREVYAGKLAQHGFVGIRADSIRNYVFPGFSAYVAARGRGAKRDVSLDIPQADFDNCKGDWYFRYVMGVGDYVIMSGQKPR